MSCGAKVHPSPGAGTAAIAIRFAGCTSGESHARCFASSSTVCCDLISLVAALRLVQSWSWDATEPVAILCSSVNAVEIVTGHRQDVDRRMCDIAAIGRSLWAQLCSTTTICRIRRTDSNAASEVCRTAFSARSGCGNESLFPDSPFFGTTPAAASTAQPPTAPSTEVVGFNTFDEFLNLPRPYSRTIARHEWPRWSRMVHRALSGALTADTAEASHWFRVLLRLPSHILRCRPERPPVVASSTATSTQPPPSTLPHRPSTNALDDAVRRDGLEPSALRRCIQLADDGLIAKAVQALCPSKLADLSRPEIVAAAQVKFPARKEIIPPLPIVEGPTIDGSDVLAALDKMSNGTASAFSGWSKELLRAAIAVDETIADLYARVRNRLVANGFDDLSSRCILASRFVGPEKPKAHPDDATDLRPICVGDLMYKIAGATASTTSTKQNKTKQNKTEQNKTKQNGVPSRRRQRQHAEICTHVRHTLLRNKFLRFVAHVLNVGGGRREKIIHEHTRAGNIWRVHSEYKCASVSTGAIASRVEYIAHWLFR